MRALDRKLARDLWDLRGQALAIMVVIAAGLGAVLMSFSTLDSLRLTRERYYLDYGFADVFAGLKRAPLSVAERIQEIPGVGRVETRVVAPVTVDVEGFTEPVRGLALSVPEFGPALLNRLYLRAGRPVEPGRNDETVLGEAFAEQHGLQPGDGLAVIVGGQRRELDVVGVALSPEYIYQVGPGQVMPDFKRFGILWMGRGALAAAYDMEGSFNDVALTLAPGAREQDVIDRLDELLEPYGRLGAYGRDDQQSHRFLSEEFKQLQHMGSTFSVIFLGVSAFLLHMVMQRLVSTQREQIAALKAFGYSNVQIGAHFGKLVILIVLGGSAAGACAGIWLGHGLAGVYMDYYRLPYLEYELQPLVVTGATLVTAGAALAGTFFAVRGAVRLPPAQAMRPAPPAVYRPTLLERAGLQDLFSQPGRMILRHIERRWAKTLASTLGIAFAGGIVVAGVFFDDAMDFMVEAEFRRAQREDMAVAFTEPTSRRALYELASLPGVTRVEPYRAVPARLRHGHRERRVAVQGLAPGAELHRTLDVHLEPIAMPAHGLLLSETLALSLDARPGSTIIVEVLEGSRPIREVPVAGVVKQFLGMGAYMDLDRLNRMLREGDALSGAFLAVEERTREQVYARLKEMPRVAGTRVQAATIKAYYDTIADVTLTYVTFISALAAAITFGVVYNSARIDLSERARELASLRVLGFTRAETAYILLGELTLITLAAIPLGFAIGHWMAWRFAATVPQELFRIPLVLEADTYATSALVVLISALISGLVVWRKLKQLDMISVLKTKE